MPLCELIKTNTHVLCNQCSRAVYISDSRNFEDLDEHSVSLRCGCGHYDCYFEAHLISSKQGNSRAHTSAQAEVLSFEN